MNELIEAKSKEIRRLHNVCNNKNELLQRSVNTIRLLSHLFSDKISKERSEEINKLIADINNELD